MSAVPSPRPQTSAQPVTRLLAEQALAYRFEELPAPVKELARQCLLDTIAVMLAARDEPVFKIVLDEAKEQGGNAQASIIGAALKTSLQQAALVNGTSAHALDYDDVNLAISGHPSAAIVPALLALAEYRGASGAQFIAAFVAGYETACRVGALVEPEHYERGFHATATVGSFGAAAACAHLIGLDAQQTARAFGIAGTQAAGLKAMFGTMCKPLHAGLAARNGVAAASLAQRGLTSREDVLECKQGFAATQSTVFDAAAALGAPPQGFHIYANLFKYHASCYGTHSAIECARSLRDQHRLTPERIRKVSLRVDDGADGICNIPLPANGLEAKFSLRVTTALALAGIDTADLGSYSEAQCRDARIVALRDKTSVELMPGDWPLMKAALSIETDDGGKLEAEHDAGVPYSDIGEQGRRLAAKFTSLTVPLIGREHSERLQAAVQGLEKLRSIAELTELCAPGAV
jgi:2-methylcitrate dehydratase PrpD